VEFRAAVDAINAWNLAKKFLAKKDDDSAWLAVKYALSLDPSIYKVIEKDNGSKSLKKLPDWQATLDDAIKRAQEQEKNLEERRKAAEDERKRKAAANR